MNFWVKLLSVSNKSSFFQTLKYIATNPIIVLISSMPILVYIIYLWYNNNKLLFSKNLFWSISIPVFCCFIAFLATSFRKTRFLGEPERYLEFGIGIASIMVGIYYNDNSFVINTILIVSLAFIALRF